MEQPFNQSVLSEHSRFDHENDTLCRHPKYEIVCSVRNVFFVFEYMPILIFIQNTKTKIAFHIIKTCTYR